MKWKTKTQIIIFIRNEGKDFAEQVRIALNEHPLNNLTINSQKSFNNLLIALQDVLKDVLEDAVNDVLSDQSVNDEEIAEEEEETDTDEEEDEEN